jgi:hypothetical protein
MDGTTIPPRHRARSAETKGDATSRLGVVVRFVMMAMLLVMMMSTLGGKCPWCNKSHDNGQQQKSH